MGLHMGISSTEPDQLVDIKAGDRYIFKYNPAAPALPSEESFAALEAWKASGLAYFTDPPPLAEPAWQYEINDKVDQPLNITGNQTVRIKAKNVFGGEESEGGIEGTLDVMFGAADQAVNPRLQQMFGGLVPAFRRRFTLFFDGMVCAMSKYPKPWSFRVRRALKGWDGETWYETKAKIILDGGNIHAMNGAHIIYECLTNRDWGRGHGRARLDDAAFRACADVLYAEGFGLCIKWSRQDSVGNFIQVILNHIGANLFMSRNTGLWTLRLVRDDYDVDDVLLFDSSTGLLGIDGDESAASVQGANELVVNYIRPVDNTEGAVRIQNAAAVRAAGGVLSESVDYHGIPTPDLALRVAQRDVRAKFGVKKFTVRLDRRGYKIEPGGVFRVSDPARGISNLVLRAGRIEDGALSAGVITVSAVMDVFGLPANSYVAVQEPLFTMPSSQPEPVTERIIGEATYRDTLLSVDDAQLAGLTPGTNFLTVIAAAPTGFSLNYQLDTRVGTVKWRSTEADFTPNTTLTAAIPKTIAPVVASVAGIDDLVEIGTAVMINTEILRVAGINQTDLTLLLARGCVDTVPAEHEPGARVWFYEAGIGVDDTEYAAGVTVQARLLTKTGAGKLNVNLAPVITHVINQRRERPYPPAQVMLNSAAYPEKISGPLSIAWAHRDRTIQADQLIDQSINSIGPEADVYYSLAVKGEGGVTLIDEDTFNTSRSLLEADEEHPSVVDFASNRVLRAVGFGILTGTLDTNMKYKDVLPIDGGWARIQNTTAEFFNGTTGAITTRTRTDYAAATTADLFAIKAGVYVGNYTTNYFGSVDNYDPFVGYALVYHENGGGAGLGKASDLHRLGSIPDRRPNTRAIVSLTDRIGLLEYQASSFWNRRVLSCRQLRLHVTNKTAIITGPYTTTQHTVDSFYYADLNQFDTATGYFGIQQPVLNGRVVGFGNGYDIYRRLAVIFDGLMYIPHQTTAASESTAGRNLDITNVLDAHIDITTTVAEKTKVYSIDLDGNIALLATRNGLVIADQVSATTGVEITDNQIRTVNSTTGALGSVIATLPGSVKVMRVVGDLSSSTFYVLGSDYKIYHYDLTGTLLADLQLPQRYSDTGPFWMAAISDPVQICITQNYVYVFPTTNFSQLGATTYRAEKDLSSFGPMYLNQLDQGINAYVNLVSSRYDSTTVYASRLLDENAISTSITPVDLPRLHDTLTIELESVQGVTGLSSHQKHVITTKRLGYGLRYGESYED